MSSLWAWSKWSVVLTLSISTELVPLGEETSNMVALQCDSLSLQHFIPLSTVVLIIAHYWHACNWTVLPYLECFQKCDTTKNVLASLTLLHKLLTDSRNKLSIQKLMMWYCPCPLKEHDMLTIASYRQFVMLLPCYKPIWNGGGFFFVETFSSSLDLKPACA